MSGRDALIGCNTSGLPAHLRRCLRTTHLTHSKKLSRAEKCFTTSSRKFPCAITASTGLKFTSITRRSHVDRHGLFRQRDKRNSISRTRTRRTMDDCSQRLLHVHRERRNQNLQCGRNLFHSGGTSTPNHFARGLFRSRLRRRPERLKILLQRFSRQVIF